MPKYKATHIPYGLTDPSKRTIVNPGIKDEAEFLKYGIETGGDHFYVRTLVNGGGGKSHVSRLSRIHKLTNDERGSAASSC